jgi:hypothetical protein
MWANLPPILCLPRFIQEGIKICYPKPEAIAGDSKRGDDDK